MSHYFFVCVSYDHSVTTDPSCALYVLHAPNNLLCIFVANNTADKYVTPFDDYVYLKT